MSGIPNNLIPDENKYIGTLPDCPECGDPVNRGKFHNDDLHHIRKGCWFEAKPEFERYTPMPCPDCGHPSKDESNRHYTPWYDVEYNHYTCDRCLEVFNAPGVYEKFGYTRLPRDHPNVADCPACDGVMTMVSADGALCLKCRSKIGAEDN